MNQFHRKISSHTSLSLPTCMYIRNTYLEKVTLTSCVTYIHDTALYTHKISSYTSLSLPTCMYIHNTYLEKVTLTSGTCSVASGAWASESSLHHFSIHPRYLSLYICKPNVDTHSLYIFKHYVRNWFLKYYCGGRLRVDCTNSNHGSEALRFV